MKKNNPISVSVCIPAFNEEKNIKHLLSSILKQNKSGYKLKEVLVYCDGCSDSTVIKAKEVKSKIVWVIDSKKRKGKTYGVKQLIKKFTGDFLILLDGDLGIADQNVIKNLLSAFKDPKVVLVSGNIRPYYPENFLQKGIYSTFEVFYESKIKVRGGDNIFGCQGGFMGIRKKFAKKTKLPEIICDDAYLYLKTITGGYKFKYVDSSVVFYKIADNLKEYINQLLKGNPDSMYIYLKKYFGEKAKQELYRPTSFYLGNVFRAFSKRPLPTLFVIILNLLVKPVVPFIARRLGPYY